MAARLLEDPIRISFTIVGEPDWLRASIPVEDKPNYKYLVVQESKDLDELERWLSSRDALGWDTETTGDPSREKDGLHPHSRTSRLVLFQIGDETEVYLVQPELLEKYPHFKRIMENDSILHIGQNLVFDFKYLLAKYGIHPLRMWCTMLAEQVLTAGLKGIKANLKSIVRRYEPCVTISKETRDEFQAFTGMLTGKILYYSARDVYLLFSVYRQQVKLLEHYDLLAVAHTEFDCIPITAEMELGGLIIREEILQETLEYNQAEADRVSAEFHQVYNQALRARGYTTSGLYTDGQDQWYTVNLGSTKEKMEALHRIGLDVPSTESDVLEQLDHPAGPLIAEWMGYDKIISTYGERLIRMIHPDTGKFHPRFLQMGEGESAETDKSQSGNPEKGTIATGRYSSNAQQFPKEKKVFAKVTDQNVIALVRQNFNLPAPPQELLAA